MDLIFRPYERYFDFSGRSRRLEYWSFNLFGVVVCVFGAVLMYMGGLRFEDRDQAEAGAFDIKTSAVHTVTGDLDATFWFGLGIVAVFTLFSFIPSLAVTVRRLHDRNRSGFWLIGYTVIGAIPVIGLISNLFFLVDMLRSGTPGSNRFGTDPRYD